MIFSFNQKEKYTVIKSWAKVTLKVDLGNVHELLTFNLETF